MKPFSLLLAFALLGSVSAQTTAIEIGGSSNVYPISVAMAEEYGILRPESEVVVQINGTSAGLANFCATEMYTAVVGFGPGVEFRPQAYLKAV